MNEGNIKYKTRKWGRSIKQLKCDEGCNNDLREECAKDKRCYLSRKLDEPDPVTKQSFRDCFEYGILIFRR